MQDQDDAQAAIRAGDEAFAACFNRKDAAGLAALYTEDAAIFPPLTARADGRAAIQAFWQAAMDAGFTDATLTPVEVTALGDKAIEVGRAVLHAPAQGGGAPTPLPVNYIVIWHKGADGTWRLHRDIWNVTAD